MCPTPPKNRGTFPGGKWAAGGGAGKVSSPGEVALKVDKLKGENTPQQEFEISKH